jgi:hypothetical protein
MKTEKNKRKEEKKEDKRFGPEQPIPAQQCGPPWTIPKQYLSSP